MNPMWKAVVYVWAKILEMLSWLRLHALRIFGPSPPSPSPWPMFLHDRRHTGHSSATGGNLPELRWTFQTGDWVMSPPCIGGDGAIYVGSNDRKIYALNPDGSRRWDFQTGGEVRSSPAIDAVGIIYVGSMDANVYALNPDGSEKWHFATGGGTVTSSPVTGFDAIYVGSYGKIYALDYDGVKRWEFPTLVGGSAGYVSSSPALDDRGRVYVGVEGTGQEHTGKVVALNPDGTEIWEIPTQGRVSNSPVIGDDGTVYIDDGSDKFLALNPEDGTTKWEYPGVLVDSSAALNTYGIYFGANIKVFALSLDGRKRWDFDLRSVAHTPAISDDGVLYVGSGTFNPGEQGRVYALYIDGTSRWEFSIGGYVTSPAIGNDGTIYIGSSDGKLYAIRQMQRQEN